jgi:hypothetical protein
VQTQILSLRSASGGRRVHLVSTPPPVPESDDEQRRRELVEQLQVAHDAAELARKTIATIQRDVLMRFPLASSTRVDAHERND